MPPKKPNVCVSTIESEFDFTIKPNTTGMEIFDQVATSIRLREVTLFGLQYTDGLGHSAWIKLNKRIFDHDIRKEVPLRLNFRVKFYPEDVTDEILEDITLKLLYLQIKDAILSDEIYCPPDTSVLLASYAVQVKHGNHEEQLESVLSHERLLAQRVKDQHSLSNVEWEEQLISWWKDHTGMKREEAMMEYLRTVENLDMYGVNYFRIKNRKGTQLWLGVDSHGLNIYSKEDKLTPKIAFPWSEINKIMFKDTRFIIRPLEKNAPDFIFLSSRLRFNKRILAICIGNHNLYLKRRRPDAVTKNWRSSIKEVTYSRQDSLRENERLKRELSAREREEKKQLENERLQRENLEREIAEERQRESVRLKREVSGRERAERKQREYEKKLKKMQKEVAKSQEWISQSQDTIRSLEDELKNVREAKELLEDKQFELEEMIARLETSEGMQLTERQMLKEEIRNKQAEVERISAEIEMKNEEVRRLREERQLHDERELQEARYREEERKLQEERKVQEEMQLQEEKRVKEEIKLQEERRVQEEMKFQEERRAHEERKLQEERRVQEERKLQEEREFQKEQILQEETKLGEERRRQEQRKFMEERTLQEEREFQEVRVLLEERKLQKDRELQEERKRQEEREMQQERKLQEERMLQVDRMMQEERKFLEERKLQEERLLQQQKNFEEEERRIKAETAATIIDRSVNGSHYDGESVVTKNPGNTNGDGHHYAAEEELYANADIIEHERLLGHADETRQRNDKKNNKDSLTYSDTPNSTDAEEYWSYEENLMDEEAEAALRHQAEITAAILSAGHEAQVNAGVNAATAVKYVNPNEDKSTAAIIASSRNPSAKPQRHAEFASLTQESADEDISYAVPYWGVHYNERERNSRLKSSFKKLTQELAEKRDETKDTPLDKIHYANVRVGRDKYGSLREVRRGDTKRRVDFFENM